MPPERTGRHGRGARRGHQLPARRCARGWTRDSSCPRRWCGPPGCCRAAPKRALGRLDGRYTEDEWGFDEDFAQTVEPLLDFLYDQWWRVQATGVEKIPAHGRALLAGQPRRHPARGTRR